MSAATERVAEFLQAWAKLRDKGDLVYGVGVDPEKDGTADLLASDLQDILEDLATCRDILSAPTKDSGITISGIDFEAAVPSDTEARFWLSPEQRDWVGVSLGNAGDLYVHTAGSGVALDIRPVSSNVVNIALRHRGSGR